jgi:hypothetical protein
VTVGRPESPDPESTSASALRRFERSMTIDYERWHDGTGYDLDALASATPEERAQIQRLLLARGARGWRDVEALAALDSPQTRDVLARTLAGTDTALAAAVARYAPHLVSDAERTRVLVAAIDSGRSDASVALEIESFHPPAVVEALLRGTLERDGATAMQFAALLLFVHGKAESPYDWSQRPFLLRFATEDRSAREAPYRELRERIGTGGVSTFP